MNLYAYAISNKNEVVNQLTAIVVFLIVITQIILMVLLFQIYISKLQGIIKNSMRQVQEAEKKEEEQITIMRLTQGKKAAKLLKTKSMNKTKSMTKITPG